MEQSITPFFFECSSWFKRLGNRYLCYCLNALLLLIIIPLFVPFSPKMPSSGLDSSWALALNQAVAQGLVFGKDIIFTLGPYSAIYSKFYHPATDGMMLWGSLYLAGIYWFALAKLNMKVPWCWSLALTFFLLTGVYAKDTLFLSYPLLVGLVAVDYLNSKRSLANYLALFFIVTPLGLFPLIKGSFLLLCGATVFLCVLLFLVNRRYDYVLLNLVAPLIALVGFWMLAGQPIGACISYVSTSLQLAFSFTAAMSTSGNSYEMLAYLLTSSLLLYILAREALPAQSGWFVWSLFFLFLFISFKAGFIRSVGHALIPATSILMAALLLAYYLRSKWLIPIIAIALTTSLCLEGQYTQIAPIKNIESTYSAAWYGLSGRLSDSQWLNNNYLIIMNYIAARNAWPVFKGTSDVYSHAQTDLIASGNTWSPRPIIQSYSVFNKDLAQLNQRHLLAAHSPDTLFFKIQPLDNRLPAIEDGASWLTIMSHYQPKTWAQDFLVLERKVDIKKIKIKELPPQAYRLGQTVFVPQTDALVFVEIEINPTFWGRLLTLVFKPQELSIVATLSDGSQRQYRFIAPMAKSAFLLSPLIEHTHEFWALYQSSLSSKKINSFVIYSPQDKAARQWNAEYTVRFKLTKIFY